MIGLILNSGLGSRLGDLTATKPKCLVELADGETILARQLRLLWDQGIKHFVITTGPYTTPIEEAARNAVPDATFDFVNNPDYATTNYIYSIHLARPALVDQEVVSLHGDLVFDAEAAKRVVEAKCSCVTIDSSLPLPEKDFKATLVDEDAPNAGAIKAIGVNVWDEPNVALQPFYHLYEPEWNAWLDAIAHYCDTDQRTVYAENAFNENSQEILIWAEDLRGIVCQEVDTVEDLENINKYINLRNTEQTIEG